MSVAFNLDQNVGQQDIVVLWSHPTLFVGAFFAFFVRIGVPSLRAVLVVTVPLDTGSNFRFRNFWSFLGCSHFFSNWLPVLILCGNSQSPDGLVL